MYIRGGLYRFSVFEQLCYVIILLTHIPTTDCIGHIGVGNIGRGGGRNGSGNEGKQSKTWLRMPELKSPVDRKEETVQKAAAAAAALVRRSLGLTTIHDDLYKLYSRRRTKLPYSLAMDLLTQYYDCIKRSHTHERRIYETYVVKPGQRLLLHCHQCFKPGTTSETKEKVRWQHLQEEGTVLSRIQPKGNYKITKKRNLIIKAVNSEHDGYYYCLNGNQYEAIHQVTTVTNSKFHTVSENTTKSFLMLKNLTGNNLKLFSTWSSWSKCSQCGKQGFRRKIGLCSVMKINQTAPIKPVDVYIFYYFDGSLLCQSTALPKEIRELPAIESRPNEVFYSKCQVPCPKKPESTIIKDQTGKVVEVVMPGYLSLNQKRKTVPLVKRDVLYTTEGRAVIIKCHTDEKIIRWENGSTPLMHFLESRKTKGRVYIDITNSLHIKVTRFSDTSTYSCWKENLLLQTTKLVVTEAMVEIEDSYIIYILTGITIFGLLMTSCSMYSGRHKGMVR